MENNQAQMETPPVGGTQQPQPQPELTITDLGNVRSVLEVAVRRGAFAANELSGVGAVYDKLNVFLTAIASQAQPQQESQPTE